MHILQTELVTETTMPLTGNNINTFSKSWRQLMHAMQTDYPV